MKCCIIKVVNAGNIYSLYNLLSLLKEVIFMEKSLFFDYAAMVIEIVLLGSMLLKRMTNGKLNRAFILMVSAALLTDAMDILAVSYDRSPGLFITEKMIFHTLYLLMRAFTSFFCLSYFIMITDTWFKALKNTFNKLKIFLPITIAAIAMTVNLFTHHTFYISATGEYVRGPMFFMLYIVNGYYAAYAFLKIFNNRKMLGSLKVLSIYFGSFMMMCAAAIQFFIPNILIDMFANATGLLFLFIMIQRPEEITDSETGLLKMSAYDHDIVMSFNNKKPETIIMIQITNFTVLRDMLGYRNTVCIKKIVADNILQTLKKNKVHGDVYYTDSGNYRIKLEGKQASHADLVAEIINDQYKHPLKYNELHLNLIVCVCIAKIPDDIDNHKALIALGSDLKNNYTGNVLYASAINNRNKYNVMRDIDGILENAIANDQFEVYYQPIYSIKEKRFNSAEALIRLHTEKYGFISPELFIPVAEKSGSIHKIGQIVMEQVCEFIGSTEYAQLDLDYIEINLSPAQCMENDLAKNMIDIMDKNHVQPEQVNLEITESASGELQNSVMDNITALHNAGINFSLDDFGTGYSNMTRIAALPFRIIKLDKTFTKIDDNPNLIIVLENVIKMIKALNMKVVVEGIETKELVDIFSGMDCEYIQGYYYSKPLPKKEFIKFILSQKAG